MIIKQEETLEWIEQMQTAMSLVVEQCGDLRRQLPSARKLPPPPKVEIQPKTEPPKTPLVKKFSFSGGKKNSSNTSNKPATSTTTSTGLKPLPTSKVSSSSSTTENGASSKPPLPEIKDPEKILSKWKDAQAKSNEMSSNMNEVLISMREMRLSPRLGEATRQLPPPPEIEQVSIPSKTPSKNASTNYQTPTVSSTHNRKLTSASPRRGKPEMKTPLSKTKMTKTPIRRFSKDLDDRGKSPARGGKSPAMSRPDLKSRSLTSQSPATSRPSSSLSRSSNSASRPDSSSSSSKSKTRTSSSSSLKSASKEADPPKKKSTTPGGGLKAMMAKNRQQKSTQEDDVEIFVSPPPKEKKQEEEGFSYTPPAPPPEAVSSPAPAPQTSSPRATSTPQNNKVEIYDEPRYFTAAARVVVRNENSPQADEVGELSKGDVAKCDMARGDWMRVVDMVGWHDPDRTLQESGAWVLSRNKVKEMMVPANEDDVAQVEALFKEQQEKKIAAAAPPPKKGGGANKTPTQPSFKAPTTSTPKATSSTPNTGGDEDFSEVRYFTSASNSLIRNGAEASADEVGQLKKGDVVCCDKRSGDWLRVTNMFGLVDPDPKRNTLAQTGAWVLSRNKVKEMMVPANEDDVAQVEALFKEQQEKKIAAAAPPPKKGGGANKTPTPAFTPPPKPVSAVAVKTEKYPKYFKTMNKCTVRQEPDSCGDELCELAPGRVIKCLSGTENWARATSLPEVNKAMSMGMIPNDITYEFNVEDGVDDSKKKGMWLLIRNKKREMLMEIDETEGMELWLSQGGVDLYGGGGGGGGGGGNSNQNLNQDMESEALVDDVEEEVPVSTLPTNIVDDNDEDDDEEEATSALWYEVTSKGKISIRSKPTGEGDELGILKNGDQVATMKEKGDWFYIKFPFEESSLISGGASNVINSSLQNSNNDDDENGHHVLEGWVLSKLVKRDVALFKLLSPKIQAMNNKKYAFMFGLEKNEQGDEQDDEQDDDDGSMGLTEYEMLAKMRNASIADSDSSVESLPVSKNTSKKKSSSSSSLSDWPKYFVIMSGPLHLHSNPGVGGRIVEEVNNGEMIKAIGERASWLEIELRNSRSKTAFLSKSKSSSRSIVQAADNGEAERQWMDQ